MGDAGAPSLIACTIVARNYLPAARVLASSYLRHHPRARLAVLVVDAVGAEPGDVAGHHEEYLTPAALDLDPDEFTRMAAAYTVTELSTALKPWLLRWALQYADAALYLDPDIEVYAPLLDLAEQTVKHGIVLTPHVLAPMPRDGLRPTEADIMAAGVFNLGFIAVSIAAEPFLAFWQERLRTDAISAPAEQLFTDQRWVDNVPALYPHVVVEDPGWNVAYWNVYQRPLEIGADAAMTAGGHRLCFFHFSGYRPEKPWLLSTHFADRPRVLLSEHPALARLCGGYRERLIAEGYAETLDSVPYRFSTLSDGTPLPAPLRRAYRTAWLQSERDGVAPPPSPFSDDPGAFLTWATGPADAAQRRAGSNRWAMMVWSSRPDLQQAFPHPLGVHAGAFRRWCAESGVREGCLPPAAVPREDYRDKVPISADLGANLLGYLTAELGVGELGRLVHEAVVASGLPVTAVVEDATVVNRTEHALPPTVVQGPPRYPVTLLCVNADMTISTLDAYPDLAGGRYVIGVWSWELDDFPPAMRDAFSRVDEVWTISEFCRHAIAQHSPVPVHTFPVPVREQPGSPEPPSRTGGPTRFLFAFDHNSVFERKNPLGLITAFQRAFPNDEDVELVVKSINGDRHPGDRERLRAAAAADPRIELLERCLSSDEVAKLFTTADCYVSLHRSEGFGLTIAEAMSHGLPVIATDYSGSSEILPPSAGWPVPVSLVDVGSGHFPYPADAHWADPDLDVAADAMRAVTADPREAARRGAAGRAHVAATRSQAAAAGWVTERLTAAFHRWQPSRVAPGAGGPQAPLEAAREALRWQADAGAPSRIPLAPALRRAVLRALNHYDQHQRTVLGTLMDGVQQALVRSDEEMSSRLDRLQAELDRATSTERRHREQAGELAARRCDELDEKMTTLLAQRDLGADELRRRLDTTGLAVLRHHDLLDRDLLDVESEDDSEAVLTDVGVLRLPADDTVVLPWLRTYGTWEQNEAAIIDELLAPGSTFVDIGAHVGYYTVRALRRVGADGAVIAVEPWARVRELLTRNVRSNVGARVAAALTVVPDAAWDVDAALSLRMPSDGNSGDTRVHPDGRAEVRGVRLNDLAVLADRRVDVVKVDVQGRDHRALAGMADVLRRDRPTVLCEFWPDGIRDVGDDPEQVLAGYQQWGYLIEPVLAGTNRERQWQRAELVRLAESSPGDFITLRLRPVGVGSGG
ncbi:MAG: FkbM family methyltransferase [Pseudonocardiaceae bacterium]